MQRCMSLVQLKFLLKVIKIKHRGYIAFLYPALAKYLKSDIPGKRVLDIGCGSGSWCYKVALSGAKSVDGFDIQEENFNGSIGQRSYFTVWYS